MKEKPCQFEDNNFCTAFVCFSSQECSARGERGEPLYSEYKSMDDVKLPKELDGSDIVIGIKKYEGE